MGDVDYSQYLKNLKAEMILRNMSRGSIRTYMFHNVKFLDFMKKTPKNITKKDIKDYLLYLAADKEVRPATFNIILTSLKFFYGDVLKRRFKVDFKRAKLDKHIPTVLTKEEILRMIKVTTNIKHKILIEMLYSAGLRVSECLRLKIEHLDLEDKRGIVRRGKGRKDRYFIMSDMAVDDINEFLKKRRGNNPYLFDDHKGYLGVRSAQQIIKKAAKKAGINKRVFCHALRSSFATHLIEKGVDIHKVQRLLGHQRISTTTMYIKTSSMFLDEIKSPLDH
jgi:site-specific recombinase XerD